MALDLKKIKQLQQQVKETGKDLNKPSGGGGDFDPPAEGPTRMRLVSYVETGIHTSKSGVRVKTKPRCLLTFELSGPLHPPIELDDGRKIPQRIVVKEIVGTSPKNNYIKLFNLMKSDYPDATNFVDLLGKAFSGDVSHYTFKGTSGDVTIPQLRTKAGYQIGGLTYKDRESGELRKLKVDAPLLPLTVFLWDYADTEQWDALFIDGEYDNGDTKNKVQELIKSAENFVGSPIYEALVEAGRDSELEPAAKGADRTGDSAEDADPEEVEEAEEAPVKEAPKKAPAKAVAASKKETKATPAPAKKTAAKPAKQAEPDNEDDDGDPLAGLD